MPTRIVMPLVRSQSSGRFTGEHPKIAPLLVVQGESFIPIPLDLATIRLDQLGDEVDSFAGDAEAKRKIQDALDIILKPY
jgi:hypothetical protein